MATPQIDADMTALDNIFTTVLPQDATAVSTAQSGFVAAQAAVTNATSQQNNDLTQAAALRSKIISEITSAYPLPNDPATPITPSPATPSGQVSPVVTPVTSDPTGTGTTGTGGGTSTGTSATSASA